MASLTAGACGVRTPESGMKENKRALENNISTDQTVAAAWREWYGEVQLEPVVEFISAELIT